MLNPWVSFTICHQVCPKCSGSRVWAVLHYVAAAPFRLIPADVVLVLLQLWRSLHFHLSLDVPSRLLPYVMYRLLLASSLQLLSANVLAEVPRTVPHR